MENIFIKRKLKCNIIDVCLIGIQIIDRLEWIHSKNIIYRDIKPENFLLGIDDPNVIYIIDFGLFKKYRSSKTGKHILPKISTKFNGNFKFSSSNAIKGKESSRRDDIISLGYMLIYLIKKELPWDYTFKENKIISSKYLELIHLKDTNACGTLFNGLPYELKEFLLYAENLKFEEGPNYSYLRSILNKIIDNNKYSYKIYHFSWINNVKKAKDFSIEKKNYSRNRSLHQRILKSLENNQNNTIKNESNILLNTINISSKPITVQNSFQTQNFKESKFSSINNDIGEEKILKNEKLVYNNIIPENKLSNNKVKNFKYNKKIYFNCISNKEINKKKIGPDSLFKEKISIIKKKNKKIIDNDFTNSLSKNSFSNHIVSVKSFLPNNNLINPNNYSFHLKRKNNNKIQRSNLLKVNINLNQNLNIKINNKSNKFTLVKDKFQNYNSYDYKNNI